MGDYLRECNSGDLKIDPKTFQETWCARCSQRDCDLAGFANTDPMAHRQATWREKFFNPHRADTRLPKYAHIAQADFPNLLQKAMKLEISERRGDWSVPDVPVMDGVSRTAEPDHTDTVEEAVRRLAEAQGRPPPGFFDEPDEVVEEDEPEEETYEMDAEMDAEDELEEDPLPPAPRRHPPQPRPNTRNVPDQGPRMLGGAPAPERRAPPAPEQDPWAAPSKSTVRVVKPGTRIQFGGGGKGEVADD